MKCKKTQPKSLREDRWWTETSVDEEQSKLGKMREIFPNNDDNINEYFLKEAGGDVLIAISNIFNLQNST